MRYRIVLAALAVMASAPLVLAQSVPGEQALANAVGSLMLVDSLRERCPAAGQAPLAGEIAAWDREIRAPELRRAIVA